jgi:ligand-binding sensor domain-containing protein
MRRFLLAILVTLTVPSIGRAERLPIRAYTTADGLAHNFVHRIVADSRGFLWFATEDGLSRFDGYSFSNFSVEQGLPHRTVTDLLETRSGELWVATFGGLARFRPDGLPAGRVVAANAPESAALMFATLLPAEAIPQAREVTVLREGDDGTIWCGTRNGLFRLDRAGSRYELRRVALPMPDDDPEQRYIKDIIED